MQQVRFQTVSRYMDMMTDVNEDISDTILSKEQAKARVLRLSGRLHLPDDVTSSPEQYKNRLERETMMPSLRSKGG